MSDPRDQLLRDAARFLKAVQYLFAVLPEKYAASNLANRARYLARRIDAVVPPQQTE